MRLAHTLFNPNVMEYVGITNDFGISKFKPPEHMVGKTLEDAGLGGTRDRYGIAVLAIHARCSSGRRRDPILFPSKDEEVEPGDILFVAGRDDLLNRVRLGEIHAFASERPCSRPCS